jgi:hypothetical protein
VRVSIHPLIGEMVNKTLKGELSADFKHKTRPLFDTNASGANPVFADATARDAALTSPQEGDKCYVTGLGEQNYNGASWDTNGTSTPQTASLGVKKVVNDFQADLLASGGLVLNGDSVETDKASQAEAEAGVENTKVMSALRVKQAIDANTVTPDSSTSASIVSTGLVLTTTTTDLTVPLGDTGFKEFEIDLLIGASDNGGTGGDSGNVTRHIIKGVTGGGLLRHVGSQSTNVNIDSTVPASPVFYGSISTTLPITNDVDINTTTTTINSITISGSDLLVNYTVDIGTAGTSAGIVKVRSFIVNK